MRGGGGVYSHAIQLPYGKEVMSRLEWGPETLSPIFKI